MTDEASLESVLGDEGDGLSGEPLPLETPTNDAPGDETDTDPPPGPGAPKAEEPAAGKKPEDEDAEGPWTKRAVLDERRKRQELEREIAELRSRQNPGSAAPEPKARPDVFEDQDGAFGYLQQQFEHRRIADRIEVSQELMRDKHGEAYDEAEAEFIDLTKKDPSLIEKMQRATLPAKFVFETIQQHRQLQELKDPEAYKAKLRAEIRAELEAELAGKGEPEPTDGKTPPPPQLVNRRSAAKEPVVHESLEDILGA